LRDEIDALLASETAPDAQRFDALANNIGVLGFLVDMLSYQPELAKRLFVFDPEQKLLRAIVPTVQRSAPPTPAQDVEQAAEQLRQDIAQGLPPEQAEQRLAQLRAEAELAGLPALSERLLQPEVEQQPAAAPMPAPENSAEPPATAAAVEPVVPLTAAAPQSQPAVAPGEVEPQSAEDELLDIFLEEAREVIANARELAQHLRAAPDDEAALTSLRRAFHTLKGSSRMVGLREYGEAAWALEQVFNREIAERHRANPALLDLAQLALNHLGQWTEAIAQHAAAGYSSEALRQAAASYTATGTAPAALVEPAQAAPQATHEQAEPPTAAQPAAERPPAPQTAAPADVDALLSGIDLELSPLQIPPADTETAPQTAPAEAAGGAEPAAAQPPAPPAAAPADVDALLSGIDLELPPLQIPPADTETAPQTAPAEAAPVVEEVDMAEFEAALAAQSQPQPATPQDQPAADAQIAAPPPPTDAAPLAEPAPAAGEVAAPQPPVTAPPAPDAAFRQIGDLRIPTPLYTIYLAEADELSRTLQGEIHAWLAAPTQPLSESAVVAAHKLAGSSATVGLRSVAELASQTEHVLDALRALPPHAPLPADLSALEQAASDIKRLLHQFAAGLLKPVQPELLARLDALRETAQSATDGSAATPTVAEPSLAAPAAAAAADTSTPPLAPPQAPQAHEAPEAREAPEAPEAHEAPEAPSATAAAPQAPAAAEPSALRATLPEQLVDTIDPDLFPIFEEEASDLLPTLAASLRQWEQRPEDATPAKQAMRALHTFKGSARMAGAMLLGEMAHNLESDIESLAANTPVSEADLAELLSRFDRLNARFDRLRSAAQQGQTQLGELPESRVAEAVTPPQPSLVSAPAAPAAPAAATAPDAIATPEAQPTAQTTAPRGVVTHIAAQAVRVRAGLLDRLVNEAGEITISRARLENEFAAMRQAVRDLGDNLERLRQQVREIEIQAEAQMTAQVQAAREEHREFDPLEFDRYTRTQELTRMMAESVNDIAAVQSTLGRLVREADDELTRQARQTRELQRDLLRTRMVEFDSLSERLYRTVRQAAKDLGKAVRLEIVGGTIELDRGVLERVAGSFDHLLRNAVAHGIESPQERRAKGKPETGTITLSVRQDGNEVVVTVADDGRGLDYAAIRAKAEQLGLIAPGQTVSDDELAQMVFRPNFSSAQTTSAVAGRGVGLDVVRAEVAALGGRVLLDNQPGAGARFTLLLPLTTAITHVVLLRTGEAVYAVPANLVDIVLRFKPEQIAKATHDLHIDHAGSTLPFFWFGALLGHSGASSEPFGKSVPVVVIRSATQRVAIQVDEVLGNREVVVKNLGPQLSRVPGLAGISVLPSGDPALIYNPVALAAVYGAQATELMQTALRAPASAEAAAAPAGAAQPVAPAAPDAAAPRSATPLVMVVDDSITVRRVTQRFLQRNGYLVQLAKDGLDALEQLQQASTLPDVILLDIEMPRMDGFDLTRNIRADARLHALPIIMITSRIADKHRNYAAQLGVNHYLGKPYSETELLQLIEKYAAQTAATA
jgi:chemosensory pili system protein ChpA (sensor histidine kinase/response regulator)